MGSSESPTSGIVVYPGGIVKAGESEFWYAEAIDKDGSFHTVEIEVIPMPLCWDRTMRIASCLASARVKEWGMKRSQLMVRPLLKVSLP